MLHAPASIEKELPDRFAGPARVILGHERIAPAGLMGILVRQY
jgi:hypothetical protein